MTDAAPRTWLARLADGLLPTAAGGAPPTLVAAHAGIRALLATVIGLLLGAAVGFLVALLVQALPGVPGVVLGFAAGSFVGAAAAWILASRSKLVRRGGAAALLLSPLLVVLAPFVLMVLGILALRKVPTAPVPEAAPPARKRRRRKSRASS